MVLQTAFLLVLLLRYLCVVQLSQNVNPQSSLYPIRPTMPSIWPGVVISQGQVPLYVRPGVGAAHGQASLQVHAGVGASQAQDQGRQRIVAAHRPAFQQGVSSPQKPTSVQVWPGAVVPQGPVFVQMPGTVAVHGQPSFQGKPGVSASQRTASFQVQPGVLSSTVLEAGSQQVVNPDSVKVLCGETSVVVDVQRDLLGIGQLIQPSDITLGGCASIQQDPSAGVLRFEAPLQDCGSVTMVMPDALVYSFALIYVPNGIANTPIVRTNGAVVNIQCHYFRRHNVSSNAVVPTFQPFHATVSAEDYLAFSLRFMTDDWQIERSSNEYSLGDVLNIEASVTTAHHQPLRVYLDSCVATLVPDSTSEPRYDLVAEKGCLIDSKQMGSYSKFLPRQQLDKLWMQLDAFRFMEMTSSSIYITCHLTASVASGITDGEHKACSFSTDANRWIAADGNDEACGCCETHCSSRKGRALPGLHWDTDALLGPVYIVPQHPLDPELVPDAQPSKMENQIVHSGFSPAVLTLVGIVAGVVLMMLLLVSLLVIVLQKRCHP